MFVHEGIIKRRSTSGRHLVSRGYAPAEEAASSFSCDPLHLRRLLLGVEDVKADVYTRGDGAGDLFFCKRST